MLCLSIVALFRMSTLPLVGSLGSMVALAGALFGSNFAITGRLLPDLIARPGFFVGAFLAALPIGVPLVVTGISLIIRFFATVRHLILGIRNLPRNFRRLVICTSPLQEPELVPGLVHGQTRFTFSNQLRFVRKKLSGTIGDRVFSITVMPFAFLLWFFPAWFYRITLKSTAWFWWPLALLGADLRRAKDPDEFRRTTIQSLWAKTNLVVSSVAIVIFIWVNFVQSGALFRENPLLTVLEYFFVVDWSLRPWQFLSVALAVLSVVIVFLMDDAAGQYHHSKTKMDEVLLARAESKFGWIERLTRLRLIFAITLFILVGVHSLLYLNSLKCWIELRPNVELWSQFIYGDRVPPMQCSRANHSTLLLSFTFFRLRASTFARRRATADGTRYGGQAA